MSLFVFISSGPEAIMHERQYVIENSTKHTVEIKYYSVSEPSFNFSKIILGNSERLMGNEIEFSKLVSNDPEYYGPRLAFSADSMVVIFNKEKQNVFYYNGNGEGDVLYSEPKSGNPFRQGNYHIAKELLYLK